MKKNPRKTGKSFGDYFLLILLHRLEWEIVSATTLSGWSCRLSRWEWSCSTSSRLSCSSRSCGRSAHWSCTHWREWSTRLHTTHSTSYSVRIYTLYIPSTNAIEPTTIIFVSIQVERNQEFLTTLDIKLSKTVSTENIKAQLLRILLMCLDDE